MIGCGLGNHFWQIPNDAEQIVTRMEAQQILKSTDGRIIARGRSRDLKLTPLGAGIYRITCKPLEAKSHLSQDKLSPTPTQEGGPV